jgi:hypothetical protein
MPALTERQRIVFTLVTHYYAATGEPCSITYVARSLRRDRKTVRAHVEALIRKGVITKTTPSFRRILSS